MDNKDWLNLALSKMHSGQWFGWKKNFTGNERMAYENIIVHDSSITKPTEAEVNAKIAELKQAEADRVTDKQSAINKIVSTASLTDAEKKALFGE